jgi:transposase
VHAADIQDRDGGALVIATMFGMYPFLLKLYADGGYQGPMFRRAVTKIMARVNVEIVKRSDHAKGFVVLPKGWVVERMFAWLGRCRRLAKDWGKSQPQGARVPASRIHQAHLEKTMQSRMISPDSL